MPESYSYIRIEGDSLEYADLASVKAKYIRRGSKPKELDDPFHDLKILTWDLETYRDSDGRHIPFAIGVR